jgi:AcrR family transcriptional regulator
MVNPSESRNLNREPDESEARPSPSAIAPHRWQDADTESRRDLIVRAALDLLAEEGLAAVTMRSVASRLGIGTMTLYTYVDGQRGLHREMVRRGFEMLNRCCEDSCGLEAEEDDTESWLRGARTYIRFAVENPNLYKLMFDHPMSAEDNDLLHGGFQSLLDDVTEQLKCQGFTCLDELPVEARRRAGRFWIALHGLATLAIAGRLCVLEGDLEDVLRDLLPRVAPTT